MRNSAGNRDVLNIYSAMLVTLGFLVAALVTLLIAPAYRRRAVRLATDEIRRTMPLTEAEIRADKDRIRAEYAIRLHELELKLEGGALDAARQSVEINRRDALISGLEGEIGNLKTSLDEHENARRVLEHTVMDRLPKVEHRLAEAKKLLYQRDREISVLTQSAERQGRALDEATQINTQQRDEIHRLNAAITTRVARNREGLGDPRFDGEVALRSEIEALRSKWRDQAQLVSRLQALLIRAGVPAEGLAVREASHADAQEAVLMAEPELAKLRNDLADAQAALRAVQSAATPAAGATGVSHEAELRALAAQNSEQAAEIARLKAALQAYEAATADERGSAKETKISMKARLAALQTETEQQAATILSLRAEVAATNERMARQAAHFRDEMRRLGAGTVAASLDPRRGGHEPAQPVEKKSLSDRISAPRLPRPAAGNSTAAQGEDAQHPADAAVPLMAEPAGAVDAMAAGTPRRPRLLDRLARAEKSNA